MIPLTNHDFQWGRSEVVIIYPDQSNRKAEHQDMWILEWIHQSISFMIRKWFLYLMIYEWIKRLNQALIH